MFKGYREAEIGFIQIEESTTRDASMSSSSRKSALFIVIHAPKRQLVEVKSINYQNLSRPFEYLDMGLSTRCTSCCF
jgi:hypothetical protein